MMTFHLGIPQMIYCVLLVVRLVDTTIHNGEPDGKKSPWSSLVSMAIVIPLLWWGGFFG